jgi:hypothetical protein
MTQKQREEYIKSFKATPECQAIREEIAMYMTEVESVLSIKDNILYGESERLAIETVGKRIASQYLNKLLLKLIPDEVKILTKKIIK